VRGKPLSRAARNSVQPWATSKNEDRVGRSQSVEQAAHSQQRWQPLGDGRWGRVVGREDTERSVGRSHVWKESCLLNWGRAKKPHELPLANHE
jgi:hypothetical protein